MNVFSFSLPSNRTNNVNNATHYVELGKNRREISKRNYYIISSRVIIKAIIIRKKAVRLGHHQNPQPSIYIDKCTLYRYTVYMYTALSSIWLLLALQVSVPRLGSH